MRYSKIKYFFLSVSFLSFFNALAYDKTKVLFEENKGQMINAKGEKLNNVFFRANLPGVCIWITDRGLVYNFYKKCCYFCQNWLTTPTVENLGRKFPKFLLESLGNRVVFETSDL